MSDCPRCTHDPCTCARQLSRHPVPFIRDNHQSLPQGMSRIEFGLELYEAIKVVGGIQALDEQIINLKDDKIKQAEKKTRRANLVETLKMQRDTLSVSDCLALVHRYPWVAHV